MHRRWIWLVVAVLVLDVVLGGAWYLRRRERRYDEAILAAATRYRVDPALVKAVVWRESRFDAAARGRAGEIGLMQLREPAAREWAEAERVPGFSHEQVSHPGTNLLAGTWYLARLLRRYPHTDNPVAYALADYNAGRMHVLRWNNDVAATNSSAFLTQITFPGTRGYIDAVTERTRSYQLQPGWSKRSGGAPAAGR